jgi:hypothetical protein
MKFGSSTILAWLSVMSDARNLRTGRALYAKPDRYLATRHANGIAPYSRLTPAANDIVD